jgi:4-aminobutyrate aminotransferase-like enzyme
MCGQSTVRFMPPLMIREADVDEAIELLTQSLDEVLADRYPQVDRGVAAV